MFEAGNLDLGLLVNDHMQLSGKRVILDLKSRGLELVFSWGKIPSKKSILPGTMKNEALSVS